MWCRRSGTRFNRYARWLGSGLPRAFPASPIAGRCRSWAPAFRRAQKLRHVADCPETLGPVRGRRRLHCKCR